MGRHLVYAAILPVSNQTYIGETTLGLERRMQAHVRQTMMVAGRMRLNQVMSKLGGQRLVFVPIKVWSEDTPKIQRLFLEGQYIWTWNPSLNDRGKGDGVGQDSLAKFGEFLLLGKRKRTRQLMKFRKSLMGKC